MAYGRRCIFHDGGTEKEGFRPAAGRHGIYGIVALDLPDGGGYRVGMAVLMVVGRPLRVLVVDADRIPVIGKFLDDPAVFGASGLDPVGAAEILPGKEKRMDFARSRQPDINTDYQASVSAGAGFGEPPAVPRMPFRMERIFSP